LYQQTNKETMKTKFEITNWLGENREIIINKYNDLKNEQFFSGISLKEFMTKILNAMIINNIKSEKTANSKLPFLMGNIYFQQSTINQ